MRVQLELHSPIGAKAIIFLTSRPEPIKNALLAWLSTGLLRQEIREAALVPPVRTLRAEMNNSNWQVSTL